MSINKEKLRNGSTSMNEPNDMLSFSLVLLTMTSQFSLVMSPCFTINLTSPREQSTLSTSPPCEAINNSNNNHNNIINVAKRIEIIYCS